jgi:exopolysaccharide production protein ExoQ
MNLFINWLSGYQDYQLSINNRIALILTFFILSFGMNVIFPQFSSSNFQDLELDISAISNSGGNIVNQIYWVSMFILAVYIVMRHPEPCKNMLKVNSALTLLCLFALISVFWSSVPMISIRRSILFVFVVFSLIAAITYLKTPIQIFMVLYRVAILALILNITALILGMGFDLEGFFKGIHGHKNTLGPIAVVAIYTGILIRYLSDFIINRRFNSIYLIIWSVLLLISVSKTSMALLIFCPLLIHVLSKLSTRFKVAVGSLIFCSLIMIVGLFSIFLLIADLHIQEFLGFFMEDPSFTGRDVIWIFMWEHIQEELLLGFGYGSFWGIGFQSPNIEYGEGFIALLNQGHNGYLDLWAKLGLIGLCLYFMILATFSKSFEYIKKQHPLIALFSWSIVILTLTHNITESSITRGYSFIWLLQLIMLLVVTRLRLEQLNMDKN